MPREFSWRVNVELSSQRGVSEADPPELGRMCHQLIRFLGFRQNHPFWNGQSRVDKPLLPVAQAIAARVVSDATIPDRQKAPGPQAR